MIARIAQDTLSRFAHSNPVTIIIGPRQSGKTALARVTFPDIPYVSLDSPAAYESAQTNPARFVSNFPDGAIIDETHRCPGLIKYLLNNLTREAGKKPFVLVSPIHPSALQGDICAGNQGIIKLLPLSFSELAFNDVPNISEMFINGFYPSVCVWKASPEIWYAEYMMNFIDRDLRHIVNVRNLPAFRSFIKACVQHSGFILNLSAIAAEAGITHNTAKAWVEALEASHVIFQLHPHPETFGRRTFKLPKLYFHDVGLAAYLLGIRNAGQLDGHSLWPKLFETFVIGELIKTRFNAGLESNLFYWCDSSGNEISVVAERGEMLIPIRIIAHGSVSESDSKFLSKWRRINRQPALPACLIYNGSEQVRLNGFTAYPWHEIGEFGPLFSGSQKPHVRK
jgi:uncharacterized protein